MTLRRQLLGWIDRWMTEAQADQHRRLLARCQRCGVRVHLRAPVVVYHPESLSIGDDVDIGEFTHIRASGGVTIGSRVLIASHVVITSRAHPIAPPRFGVTADAPVRLEDDVWIGAGAIVLPGVTVHRGAVVAAGAVVTRDVEPMTVVAGVPAAVLRTIAGA